MWRQLVGYAQRLFSLQRAVDRHDEELKQLRQDLRAVMELLREYRHEQERDRAIAERDRENLLLRLENTLLKLDRRLPSAGDENGA